MGNGKVEKNCNEKCEKIRNDNNRIKKKKMKGKLKYDIKYESRDKKCENAHCKVT